MPRRTLFATTALVAAAWLVSAVAAAPANPTQPTPNATVDVGSFPEKDTNSAFLCNYGFEVTYSDTASDYSSGSSSLAQKIYTFAAIPIIGTGKVVNEIVVADSRVSSEPYGFYVELRENRRRSNKPGKVITGGQVNPRGGCAQITVPVAPTLLTAGKTYWLRRARRGGVRPHIRREVAVRQETAE
jgi:hypothetical protein